MEHSAGGAAALPVLRTLVTSPVFVATSDPMALVSCLHAICVTWNKVCGEAGVGAGGGQVAAAAWRRGGVAWTALGPTLAPAAVLSLLQPCVHISVRWWRCAPVPPHACTSDRVGLTASPAGALARHSTHPQMRSPSMRALLVGLCLAAAAPATGRLLLAEGPACNKSAAAWEYKDRCEALTSYQDGWGNASAGKLPPACTSGGLCCCDRLHAPSARVQCCAQRHRHPAPRLPLSSPPPAPLPLPAVPFAETHRQRLPSCRRPWWSGSSTHALWSHACTG